MQSNAGNYDFHLAIHTNAAPENLSGRIQGPNVYYYRDSAQGRAAAEIFANNLKLIYPYPELVKIVPTTTLVELRRTKAPAVLVEVAYHDNVDDANWITSEHRADCRKSFTFPGGCPRCSIRRDLTSTRKDVIIVLEHNTILQILNGD